MSELKLNTRTGINLTNTSLNERSLIPLPLTQEKVNDSNTQSSKAGQTNP